MDNNTNFYLSGFIAISLFTLCFILFSLLLFTPQTSKIYALKKDNFISVSIVTSPVEVPKVKKMDPVEKNPVVKNIDVNNLFSDVWTKKIAQK
ncbi:MAG: hypothetical protein Q9M34_10350, partial [Sulfurimonas sp.]|nr:hypothetical protein [Sulfurimonas sp.]